MSAYSEFFLAAPRSVVQLQLVELLHPHALPYRFVRNNRAGVTVTHEDATSKAYTYLPMKIEELGTRDDMDVGLRVSFGDLGEELPRVFDNFALADAFGTYPDLNFRVYRSDDLAAPLYGPLKLSVARVTFNGAGCTMEARAQRLNVNKTGLLYRFETFPMLRGYL